MEGFLEELGEEEQRRALIESIPGVVDETAAPSREAVLLEDRDGIAGFGEAGCCCYTADSCACTEGQ